MVEVWQSEILLLACVWYLLQERSRSLYLYPTAWSGMALELSPVISLLMRHSFPDYRTRINFRV